MAKSKFAAALDEVQKPLTVLLKNLGFRRRGRTYNRPVGDELSMLKAVDNFDSNAPNL